MAQGKRFFVSRVIFLSARNFSVGKGIVFVRASNSRGALSAAGRYLKAAPVLIDVFEIDSMREVDEGQVLKSCRSSFERDVARRFLEQAEDVDSALRFF